MDIIGTGFGLTITTITLLALAGIGYYLGQIRDILKELLSVQQQLAARLGVSLKSPSRR